MKTKLIIALPTALLLSMASVSLASAEGLGAAEVRVNANATVGIEAASSSQGAARGNATSTAAVNADRGNATSTDANARGQLTAESHRSSVAAFVQSLLTVADREGGIGAQVRLVAMSQQDSASTTAEAMAKVEGRSGFRTLLLGSDYRSLGQLRSEMATTSANIARLQALLSQAATEADKAELSAQIQVLEESQAKVETFVQAHESSFSFFGWLAKLFIK